MIFLQRRGTTADVPFVGIEARVVDRNGNVVADWTVGGVIADVPQGDGYRLEVRTETGITSEELAIGAVVFTLGQSNIQRWFDLATPLTPAAGTYAMERDGDIIDVTGSAATHFANTYQALAGVPVLMVRGALGGTALLPQYDKGNGHWLQTGPGSLYAASLDLLAQVGGSAELVLWGQGETDGSGGATVDEYAAGLTALMQRILVDFAPLEVLIQEIGPRGSNDGRYDTVRAAQQQVAAALAEVSIGAITTDLTLLPDGIHLTGASRVVVADRMLIEALAEVGVDLSRLVQEGSDDPLLPDTLLGTAGRDELIGRGGDDRLVGGADSDLLLGGEGKDDLEGEDGFDLLVGGAGNDLLSGGAGNDILSGGAGNDVATGGLDKDEAWLDEGDDRFRGDQGDDLAYGGAGSDTAVFRGVRAGFAVSVSNGVVTVSDIDPGDGNDGIDTLHEFEWLEFTNGVIPASGAGLPGLFSAGSELIDFAQVVAGTYAPGSQYNALGGDDEVFLPANAAAALAAGFTVGTAFDGGDGDDTIIGGSLADTMRGNNGNDVLNGGAGADRMDGNLGDDVYFVDTASDIPFERVNEGEDTVFSTVSLTLRSFIENLVLQGSGNLNGTGNAEANEITGTSGNNSLFGRDNNDVLRGFAGNDKLDGGTGDDVMEGGRGDDQYVVDSSFDVIVELTNEGSDRVSASATFTLSAQVERLTLVGLAAIDGTGNDLANIIYGNEAANRLSGMAGADELRGYGGDDTIEGGAGADKIEGGLGLDTLLGGADADRFIFRTAAEIGGGATGTPGDIVADFATGDRIDLSRIDAKLGTSTDDKFALIHAAPFTAAGQLRYEYDALAGAVLLSGEQNGDGIADFVLTVLGPLSFVTGDFSL